ncbi:hypothetical protein NC652_012828 [Populus alba x Populus x berolinensis]|nr:hypothetical protein NC652_012813 [Populus alba x Populus x berolinensis]KAJ6928804.1 hypothetical protein NC652_012828 [Populus alba x Populus x berolinensis]
MSKLKYLFPPPSTHRQGIIPPVMKLLVNRKASQLIQLKAVKGMRCTAKDKKTRVCKFQIIILCKKYFLKINKYFLF